MQIIQLLVRPGPFSKLVEQETSKTNDGKASDDDGKSIKSIWIALQQVQEKYRIAFRILSTCFFINIRYFVGIFPNKHITSALWYRLYRMWFKKN